MPLPAPVGLKMWHKKKGLFVIWYYCSVENVFSVRNCFALWHPCIADVNELTSFTGSTGTMYALNGDDYFVCKVFDISLAPFGWHYTKNNIWRTEINKSIYVYIQHLVSFLNSKLAARRLDAAVTINSSRAELTKAETLIQLCLRSHCYILQSSVDFSQSCLWPFFGYRWNSIWATLISISLTITRC